MKRTVDAITRLLVPWLALALPAGAQAAAVVIQNANFDATSSKIIVKGLLDAVPAGTAVDLIQDSNNRLLARDTDGNKQFGFQVPIAAGQAVPCVLRVQAGEETAFVQVRHSSGCGKKLLTLAGQVVDSPIPYATVTVTIGGVTYTTVADANGYYSLDIATATIEELVTIEATKKMASGDTLNFFSLAGSFSKLLEDASGNVLSSTTNQKVNVTNVSTAEYVLVVAANGDTAPTTVDELLQAETQVDATQLLELAAVIKLVVDSGYALPADYTSVLQFIQDPVAVDTFVAAADPSDLANAVSSILSENGLVAGFQVGDVPARYLITAATEPGFVPRSGDIYEFSATRPNDLQSMT